MARTPTSAIPVLLARAQAQFSRKDYAAARDLCLEILRHEPGHRATLYLLGLCELSSGRYQEAVAALSRLVAQHPDHVNGHVLLSKVCLELGDHPQSVLHARRVLELDVRDDRVLALVADLLGRSEDHISAKAAYAGAIRLNPANASHLCNLASILRIEGRTEEAIEVLERCIQLDASNCKAHWMLSSLIRQMPAHNHVARLERLRDGPRLNDRGRVLIGFALAKEYEDLGDYAKSFDRLSEACELKRASIDYDVQRDILPLRQLEELFDSAYVERLSGSGFAEPAPVFIVGLPRTGSTLIEQILSAGGQLIAGGELPTFGNEVARLLRAYGGEAADFSALKGKTVDFRALGQAYIEKSIAFIASARHKPVPGQSAAFIDKMPQNLPYVGLIMLALPRAKLIVTQRDAMDTCLSNLQQLYNDPFYQFSYRLDELGSYVIACERLTRHWAALFGPRIYTVRYEELVERPEEVASSMFAYCGLPWSREVLDRAGRDSLIATASATQVRQAIHRESIGRWRSYERQLAPLLAQLRDAGVSD
jgi:tetratricopeptide (TPR) repeat protein